MMNSALSMMNYAFKMMNSAFKMMNSALNMMKTEKLVRVLFNMARFYSPSIVFIDEIDALVPAKIIIFQWKNLHFLLKTFVFY